MALRRRLTSWWWDYLVIVAWLALLFVMVGVPTLLGWVDIGPIWTRAAAADVVIACLTVLPLFAYLLGTENGRLRATWGKRRSDLVVRGVGGGRTPTGGIVVRNLVKVLPWQFGHMAATRFAGGQRPTGLAIVFCVLSVTTLASVIAPVLRGRRGLHDRLAGTTVAIAEEGHAAGER